jgi:hypothetical protein
MPLQSFRRMAILAGMAAIALLGMGLPARADLVLTIKEDSGTPIVIDLANSAGMAMFSGHVSTAGMVSSGGDFTISLAVGSSTSPDDGETQLDLIGIKNTTGSPHTLTITVVAQGFMAPNNLPIIVADTVSGSMNSGTLSGNIQGFADATNSTTPGLGTSSPLLSFSASGFGSFNESGVSYPPTAFMPNGATYSTSIIAHLTLGGGATLAALSPSVQSISTPEPTSLAFVLTALPLLGLGSLIRRRRTRA